MKEADTLPHSTTHFFLTEAKLYKSLYGKKKGLDSGNPTDPTLGGGGGGGGGGCSNFSLKFKITFFCF